MHYAALDSSAGRIWVAWREPDAPAFVGKGEDHASAAAFVAFVAIFRIKEPPLPAPAVPPSLASRLRAAARGDRDDHGPVDPFYLTPFRRRVLERVREIPRGQVRSYGWVAREVGHPRAMRAVGSTLRDNPLGFLVPCHRVRRADATTAKATPGRTGDPDAASRDRRLQAEGVDLDLLAWLTRRGFSLCGDRVSRTYCLPSCQVWRRRGARPIYFHRAMEARAAGYRPCAACRPPAGVPGDW